MQTLYMLVEMMAKLNVDLGRIGLRKTLLLYYNYVFHIDFRR